MTTARYGDGSLYGQVGLLYGAAVVDRRLTWGLLFDWDGDGLFTGENELAGLFDLETEQGRSFVLEQSEGGSFQQIDVGRATFSYRNTSGRYDPYNAAGPLYGQLQPGRLFLLEVQDEATGTVYPIMMGRIKDIKPVYGETEAVQILCENLVQELKRLKVRTPVYATMRYDDAVAALLAEAGWIFGSTIDTTVSEAMPYWWASGRSLFEELKSISDAALAMFCIGEDGKVVYRSRISGDTPLASLTGLDVELDYGVRSPSPQEAIRNRIRVYARTRTLQANQEIWKLRDAVKIPAGESREIWADYSFSGDEGVASAITQPVATTDYTANAAAGGGGADLTANIFITMEAFATSAKLTVLNAGLTDAYMTLLRLRGDVITADKYTFVENQDDASIADFGEQMMAVQSDWLQDVNSARDEAALLKIRLAQARRYPRVRLASNPSKQFAISLFGLAQIDVASKGISGEYRLGYIKHKWEDEIGELVRTESFFEPNLLGNTSGTWIFPATFDATTVF